MKRFKIDKLVRNKMSEILKARRVVVHGHVMGQEEYQKKLKEKLLEEALEVQQAASVEELTEELADTLEVIHALAQFHEISIRSIEETRLNKLTAKGGFDARFYHHFVEVEESNPAIEYYRTRNEQYPEMLEHSGFDPQE